MIIFNYFNESEYLRRKPSAENDLKDFFNLALKFADKEALYRVIVSRFADYIIRHYANEKSPEEHEELKKNLRETMNIQVRLFLKKNKLI